MKKNKLTKKAASLSLAAVMLLGTASFSALADDDTGDSGNQRGGKTYESTFKVEPNADGDFTAYTMSVTLTTKKGALSQIDITSEFGDSELMSANKRKENQKYTTNALSGLMAAMSTNESTDVDAVTAATCTSNALLKVIAENGITKASTDISGTINGETVEASSDTDQPGEPKSESDEDSSEESGNGGASKGSATSLPEEYSVDYYVKSETDDILALQITDNLPDDATMDVKLVRVGNSAYMAMKDPEAFAAVISFDPETKVASLTKKYLEGVDEVTIALTTSEGDTSVIVDLNNLNENTSSEKGQDEQNNSENTSSEKAQEEQSNSENTSSEKGQNAQTNSATATVAPAGETKAKWSAYDITVTLSKEKGGVLNNIDISSDDWGNTRNSSFTEDAISEMVENLKKGAEVDSVSGATCSSKAIIEALETLNWNSVSENLTYTIDGATSEKTDEGDSEESKSERPESNVAENYITYNVSENDGYKVVTFDYDNIDKDDEVEISMILVVDDSGKKLVKVDTSEEDSEESEGEEDEDASGGYFTYDPETKSFTILNKDLDSIEAIFSSTKYNRIHIDVPLEVTEVDHSISCKSKDYSDLNVEKWYHPYTDYVLDKGYMTGTNKTTFAPNATVTRAMVVQVLYAMEGKPDAGKSKGFTDVVDGKYYVNAVNWAANNGIVAGYTNGKFGVSDPIKRQDLVTIMYKYAQYKGYKTDGSSDISSFSDASKVSKYATEAMKWAVGNNIVSGTKTGIEPKSSATRAQLATILYAFDKNVK